MPRSTVAQRVLLIICDDLAYGDLSRHGNEVVKTPALDSLARDGASCARYLSGPMCTPARAALTTGRHPYRTRAIDTYLGRSIIDPTEPTIARIFGSAGWRCGLFGKWHLGDTVPSRPHDLGFHEALWHTGGGLRQPANRGNSSYFNPTLLRNGEPVETVGYCADTFTDAAIDFIRTSKDQPWFCQVAYNTPHTPMEIGDEWVAPLRREGLPETWAQLYGMVANIDYNVGRLLATLAELDLADDTLVIFTSDHGPCPSASVDGRIRYNAGLRGAKGTMYEGGLRVPSFVRWPAAIPAGQIVDQVANPIDVLPTLAAAAHLPLPESHVIDGLNLLPQFLGAADPVDRILCLQWHRGNVPELYRNATVTNTRWKWYRPAPDQPDELYDLLNDPGESRNLADKHPDIVTELRESYVTWFENVSQTHGQTLVENYAPVRIPIGNPREPAPWLTRQDWRRPDGAAEGWADDQPGDWLLDLQNSGDYQLHVEFAPAHKVSRTLTVNIGSHQLTRPIAPSCEAIDIGPLSLSAGPARLKIRIFQTDDNAGHGVNFARLSPPTA